MLHSPRHVRARALGDATRRAGVLLAGCFARAAIATEPPIELSAAQRAAIGVQVMVLDRPPEAAAGRLGFSGRIEFAGQGPQAILSPAAARVIGAYAHPGERVRRGDIVLVLTGPEIHAGRDTAQAAADGAERRPRRDQELYEAGTPW